MHAELAARAPAAAAAIDPGDRSRIIRALELLEMGESPAPAGAESRLWTAELRHPTLLCGLVMEREELYRRIDARVDAMVAAGAVEEVRRADAAGASATARKALGFEELLRGDVDGNEAPHPQLRAPPAHLDAPARGCADPSMPSAFSAARAGRPASLLAPLARRRSP